MFGAAANGVEAENDHSSVCEEVVVAGHAEDGGQLLAKSDSGWPLQMIPRRQSAEQQALQSR